MDDDRGQRCSSRGGVLSVPRAFGLDRLADGASDAIDWVSQLAEGNEQRSLGISFLG
jgi:hypothetical protein